MKIFTSIPPAELPGKLTLYLLSSCIVILPFLTFIWNGVWEFRCIFFTTSAICIATLLDCIKWLKRRNTVIKFSKLDIAIGVYLLFCATNNFLHDISVLIEPSFYTKWATLVAIYIICRGLERKSELLLYEAFTLSAFLQSLFAILQYFRIITTTLNGYFINSAGFANTIPLSVYLAIGLIFGFKLILTNYNYKKITKTYLIITAELIILFAFIISTCRASILSLIFAAIIYILSKNRILQNQLIIRRIVFIGVILVMAVVIYSLYLCRIPSANTRFLLWRVSYDIFKEMPFTGCGTPGFASNYMHYQGEYFKNNPDSNFIKIANNHYQSYNIFVQTLVEQGIIGFILLLLVIHNAFTGHKNSVWQYVLLCLLCASCFTYTNHVLPLIMIFPITLGMLRQDEFIKIKVYLPIRIVSCISILFLIGYSVITFIDYEEAAKIVKCKEHPEKQKHWELCRNYRNLNLYYSMNVFNSTKLEVSEKLDIMTYLNQGMTTSEKICDMGDLYVTLGNYSAAEKYYIKAYNMVPCRVIPLGKLLELYEKKGDDREKIRIAEKILNTDYSVVSSITLRIKARAKEIIDNRTNELPHNSI